MGEMCLIRRNGCRWTGLLSRVSLFVSLCFMLTALTSWTKRTARSDALDRWPSPHLPHRLVARTARHGRDNFLLVPAVQPYRVIMEPQLETADHKFVIFVQSSPGNVRKRELIPETWANPKFLSEFNLGYKPFVFFSLGLPKNTTAVNVTLLAQEAKLNDILLLDFVDDYDNLTLKGLLTMHWINNTFPRALYVFKTDDDVLMNVHSWTSIIQALESHNMLCTVVGLVWEDSPALREGRYKLTQEQYFPEHFPSFCSGVGYLMSRDSMDAMLEASKHYPLLIRDDPYFTGIVAEKAKVDLYNVEWVDFYQVFAFSFNISMISRRTLLLHNATETQWWTAWAKLLDTYYLPPSEYESHALNITFSPARTIVRNETGYYAFDRKLQGQCSRQMNNNTDIPKRVTIVL